MWLIQKNIWKETNYDVFVSLLEKYNIKHKIVNVIPFTDQLEVDIDFSEIEMYFGAIKLGEIVKKANCKTFDNVNFNYKYWANTWNLWTLNPPNESKIIRFAPNFECRLLVSIRCLCIRHSIHTRWVKSYRNRLYS